MTAVVLFLHHALGASNMSGYNIASSALVASSTNRKYISILAHTTRINSTHLTSKPADS